MPYITREDGEHFVIPSYRDVLDAKRKSQLKKDILGLSQSYGEFITMQKKNASQYEVTFSPDTGYLLGESIWHHFKRPLDMIYCEAIPNTTEAILVIVKSGSVYLDGSFPMDSIPEELVIFLTQQNNFEIYTYGDVPISKEPQDGKFSFEESSVSKFQVLDDPVFPTLPLLKIYQLNLVDTVLKENGIGVFPAKELLIIAMVLGAGYLLWTSLSKPEPVEAPVVVENPYQPYIAAMMSPAPDQEISLLKDKIILFYTLPGWVPVNVKYNGGNMVTQVKSNGSSTKALFDWAQINGAEVTVKADGFYLTYALKPARRSMEPKISPLKQVIGTLVDRLAAVYPGNRLGLAEMQTTGLISKVTITITLEQVTPTVLVLISEQLQGMPLIMKKSEFTIEQGVINGTIILEAMGN